MEIDMNKEHWDNGACPKVDCRKGHCKCGLERVFLSAVLGDDSKDSPVAPKNGEYCNAIVVYEANNHVYIYSKEGIPTLVEAVDDVEEMIEQLEGQLAQEILDRQAADNVLQGEINDLKNSPDVVDIVATYAALQAYDTSHLGDNDIVRVLVDETHNGDSTYYRWDSQTETWTYIGGISVKAITIFYADKTETGNTRHIYKDEGLTEGATVQDLLDASESSQVVLRKVLGMSPSVFRYEDMYLLYVFHLSGVAGRDFVFSYRGLKTLTYSADASSSSTYDYSEHSLQEKLTAGSNVTISGDTISATDTTYSNFTGATAQQAGTSGLVPVPTTSDPDKYLKGDGSWDTPTDTTYTAGTNVQISSGNVISATDTTYSNFVGTDGQTAGTAGLVPAPTTADAGKFLKADGTWDTAGGGGGPTVVQTTGTSTTDVMSQDVTTKLVYPDIANNPYKMVIGEGLIYGTNKGVAINGTLNTGITGGSIAIGAPNGGGALIGQNGRADQSVAIGNSAIVGHGAGSVAIGTQAYVNSGTNTGYNVALGYNAYAGNAAVNNTVALGANAKTTRTGEVNIGTGGQNAGYNSTDYRVLGGVHDGQDAHDAVTVEQVNSVIDAINTALSTNISHIGA